MDFLLLIDGEFRSWLRSFFEKAIGTQFKKRKNKYEEVVKKVAIRVVSSLIAIQIFGLVKKAPIVKNITSIVMILLFVYYAMTEK